MARTPETIARTGVDQFHVQFYRTGGFVMTVDGAERRVQAGDVCLLDLSRPVTLRTTRIDNLSAIIPRDVLAPLLAEVGDVHGLVFSRDSEAGIDLREHLEEMWSQAPGMTVAQGHDASRAAVDLLAAILRENGQGRPATRQELRASQFRAICRRIEKQIADPALAPATLARDFYVTRPTLYRMFEPHGGIGKYILGRRLAGLFRDLSDPALAERKIAEVLRQWGFANHSAAGRAFRGAYGMSPSQCRSRARALHRAAPIAAEKAFEIPSEVPARIKAFQRRVG